MSYGAGRALGYSPSPRLFSKPVTAAREPIEAAQAGVASKPPFWRFAAALLVGAALAAFVLAAMPPAARAMLPVDPDARGEAFEQALAAQLTRIRPAGEEWAIAIDPADVNAWLTTRLPKWIEHDDGLAAVAAARTIRLASVDGALIVEDGARAVGRGAAVLSLPVAPKLADGHLRLDIGLARMGRLPVPGAASALAALLRDSLDRLAAGPAQIRLADGRRVELRAISCEPGRVALLFATMPAAARGTASAPALAPPADASGASH